MAAAEPVRLPVPIARMRQRRDGDPPVAAHAGSGGHVGVRRHQHPPPRRRCRQGRQDRIGIERDPCRRLRDRRGAGVITAAAPKLAKRAALSAGTGKERETDPGMIFETAVLHRIDRDFERRHCRGKPVEHRAELLAFFARPGRQTEAGQRHPRPRRSAACRHQLRQQRARLAGQRSNRGDVLVVERRAQRRRPLAGDAESLGDRRHQGRQGEVDREIGHPDRRQRLARHRDHLDIGGRPAGADQLGPGLPDLPLGPHLRPLDPEHLAGIAQPQRPRLVRQPGRGDAGDLRRHVGAHPDHAVRDRVHRAKGVARHRGAGARQQRLLEFDQRRLHPLVAVRAQHRHQPSGDLSFELGDWRQQIVEPRRQQRGMRHVVHAAILHGPTRESDCPAAKNAAVRGRFLGVRRAARRRATRNGGQVTASRRLCCPPETISGARERSPCYVPAHEDKSLTTIVWLN